MGKTSKSNAVIKVIKEVSGIALSESGQKFLCGTYSDGKTRNVVDAMRDEFMSPETREKMTKKDKKKKKKKKKVNEGNIYETYRNILANRQGKNEIPPLVTNNQIKKAFSAVKSGTQSSVKGGDTLLEQDKVVSKHASIINVNLVHTTFIKIENIFENFIKTNNRQDFIDSLQSLFVNNTKGRRTIDKLTKALESDARQAIEDIIQSMP